MRKEKLDNSTLHNDYRSIEVERSQLSVVLFKVVHKSRLGEGKGQLFPVFLRISSAI